MKAVTQQQLTGSFLPPISPHSKASTEHRMKQEQRKCVQAGTASDKSAQTLQTFTKSEISQLRNDLKQSLCVQMLSEGFHRSFSEIFSLLMADEERRAAAEPGSALHLQPPLSLQRDKLETMRLHLNEAEQAQRTGSWLVVCEQRLFLGQFFRAPEDLWLRLHFYHSCATAEGRGPNTAEARIHLAQIYLLQGQPEQARQQAECSLSQGAGPGCPPSQGPGCPPSQGPGCPPSQGPGCPPRLRASTALWAASSQLARGAEHNQALTLLHRGYSVAKATEDKHTEGKAAHQLGLTYQRTGDHDTAKQYFSTGIQIWDTLQDTVELGKTKLSMAMSLEREGNTHEAIQCLEKIVDISHGDEMKHNLASAYLRLGIIYYRRGEHEKAFEFLMQGFDVASDLTDVDLLEQTQVFVASARAQCLIRKFSVAVASVSCSALRRLVAWKQELSSDATHHLKNHQNSHQITK